MRRSNSDNCKLYVLMSVVGCDEEEYCDGCYITIHKTYYGDEVAHGQIMTTGGTVTLTESYDSGISGSVYWTGQQPCPEESLAGGTLQCS